MSDEELQEMCIDLPNRTKVLSLLRQVRDRTGGGVDERSLLLDFVQFMYSGVYDSYNTTHEQDVDAFLTQRNQQENVPCPNCGCPKTKSTYGGRWCDLCDNEFNDKK